MDYRTQLIMNIYNLYHDLHNKGPVHVNLDEMTVPALELLEHELESELYMHPEDVRDIPFRN